MATLMVPSHALDRDTDPEGTTNWQYNDDYTKKVICDCILRTQKNHIINCKTAHEIWLNLEAVNQACRDQTEILLIHEINDAKAGVDDNIITHLNKLKQLWYCLTLVCHSDTVLGPDFFKKILASSLPPTWDDFTHQIKCDTDKKHVTVSHILGECYEEYRLHQQRSMEQATYSVSPKSLINRIGKPAQPNQQVQPM